MPILGLPLSRLSQPVIAKVGDFAISRTSVNVSGFLLTQVVRVTATRYYYDATNYVLRTAVVWVGTQSLGNNIMAAVNSNWVNYKAAALQVINNAGGWAT